MKKIEDFKHLEVKNISTIKGGNNGNKPTVSDLPESVLTVNVCHF